MSAACAENEVASKVSAATPAPKSLKFICRLPSVRRGLLTAVARCPTHRARTHALTQVTWTGNNWVRATPASRGCGHPNAGLLPEEHAQQRLRHVGWLCGYPPP